LLPLQLLPLACTRYRSLCYATILALLLPCCCRSADFESLR
jgi:hypothetical protein